jgi:hypothetical protein
MLQLCTNQLIVWFVQVRLNDWLLVILPSPILELQHGPLPPKCCEPRNVPQLFILPQFSFQIHIWIYQGVWERVTTPQTNKIMQIFYLQIFNIYYMNSMNLLFYLHKLTMFLEWAQDAIVECYTSQRT